MGKSITLARIVFTLSFCLNLVAGKNLPYKGRPSAGAKTILEEVEDTKDKNGDLYEQAGTEKVGEERKLREYDDIPTRDQILEKVIRKRSVNYENRKLREYDEIPTRDQILEMGNPKKF